MGPEDNTKEWQKQVDMIVAVGKSATIFTEAEVDQLIILYAFDESFSRSAILHARQQILEYIKK